MNWFLSNSEIRKFHECTRWESERRIFGENSAFDALEEYKKRYDEYRNWNAVCWSSVLKIVPGRRPGLPWTWGLEFSCSSTTLSTYDDHETNASNIEKATSWLIRLFLYWRGASTWLRSTQENPAHKYSVTFEGWSSSPKTAISDNRLFVTTILYRCLLSLIKLGS